MVVSLTVVTADQFARAAVGLALEGVTVNLNLGIPDEDGEL
jgi:hypothetical protein